MSSDTDTTLLLFRTSIAELREQSEIALPDDWSAVIVSGGVTDFPTKREKWVQCVLGNGPFPADDSPFLRYALPSLITDMLWALIGDDGRLYVTFWDDAGSAPAFGLESPGKGWATYILKLMQRSEATREWIWPTFFDITSYGLAAGFWGAATDIEDQLRSTPNVVVDEQPKDMPAIHRILHDFVRTGNAPSAQQLPPLLLCPWGPEWEDGLLLTNRMSQDEMILKIRQGLSQSISVLEFQGANAYWDWALKGTLEV